MKTKHWCRTCAAYDANPCGNVGHISEVMHRVGPYWRSFNPKRLVIASPPASGRGAIEFVPCDDEGTPETR